MSQKFAYSIFVLFFLCFVYSNHIEASNKEPLYLQKEELESYSLSEWEPAFVEWRKLRQLMDQLDSQIAVKPIDATLGTNLEIIEEKAGASLDRPAFVLRFLEAFYKGEEGSIPIPRKKVYPRVDREMLHEITRRKLGTYTTFYNSINQERSTNIMLSAEAIHGTIIFPGEVFSFNQTVGERTEKRGYQRAPVIVKGEFSEDIGGGICQVSSTLFNAVDLKGIQMIERFTHSRSVPYVPPGRDATVSWWGPDFSFKNLYNEPVVITARAAYGSLTVEVLSSETVEYFQAE